MAAFASPADATTELTAAFSPTTPQQQAAIANAAALVPNNGLTPPSQPISGLSPTPGTGKPIESTVLSSTNIDQKNQDNTSKVSSAQTPGQTSGSDGFVRNADQSFAEAPSDATIVSDPNTGNQTWQSGGMTYALGNSGGKISSDPYVQGIYEQFTTLKGQMDATGAANIENIRNSYNDLIRQQGQANASNEASTYSLLARGGSLQTESSGGIIHAQVSDGLSKISDLTNKENAAIISAQQAMQTGDMNMLDKQLTIANTARTERQNAAQKLNDSIQTATSQAKKDSAIMSIISSGTTDPSAILAKLKAQGNDTVSLKDISDTISTLNPDQKEIHSMLVTAAQNGAPQSILTTIGQSKTLADAVSAAAQYVTDPTSLAGQFKSAVDAGYKGTSADWVAAQKYKDAYATASAAERAKNDVVGSSANQQKLEAQGRAVIEKELSNRSGGLGLQDAKVNQAIHLKTLFDQYKTTVQVPNKTNYGTPAGGFHAETVYNIPATQYAEVAMGLANLLSGTSQVSDSAREAILQKTAKGDINGAITYITGSPQNGSTQEVFRNLKDSIDRQGATSEQLRQTYIDNLTQLLPTDLNADRRASLLAGSSLNSYTNPNPANMTPAQIDSDAYTKIQNWATSDPKNSALLSDLSAQFPNLSNVEIAQKLKLIQ